MGLVEAGAIHVMMGGITPSWNDIAGTGLNDQSGRPGRESEVQHDRTRRIANHFNEPNQNRGRTER